jgi:hypothetical protein
VFGPPIVGLLVATPPAMVVAEAATGASFDPVSLIGSVITPVIVVVLLLIGKLHTDSDYKRVLADLEAERAERARLQTALTDRVIPALTRSTLVLEAVAPMLQNEIRLRAVRDGDSEAR